MARIVAGAFARAAPTPPDELRQNPNAKFVFDSWDVQLAGEVVDYLDARRHERDMLLDEMTEAEFRAYEARTVSEYEVLRARLAAEIGGDFDASATGDVLVDPEDGAIWRRIPLSARVPRDKPASGRSGPAGGGDFPDSTSALPVLPLLPHDLEKSGDGRGDWSPSRIRETPSSRAAKSSPQKTYSHSTDIAAEIDPLLAANATDGDLRSRTNGYDMGHRAWKAKVLLTTSVSAAFPQFGHPIDVRCSAVKVSKRIIITAGHCLFRNGSWRFRVVIPGADSLGHLLNGLNPSENGVNNPRWEKVRYNWFAHEWANYDFGLIVLYNASEMKCYAWHGWQESASGLTWDVVYQYGYPGEGLSCAGANSTHPQDLCFASMYGDSTWVVSEGAFRFAFPLNTQVGQSGSGVYQIFGSYPNPQRVVYGVERGDFGCCLDDAVRINAGNADCILDAQHDFPASGNC